ncbi:hypothetical protein J7E68_00085 [Microbacterium sp. ISL-103]|uniref:hypothetical protein n=1 Tax=Microbacterium sp. ISL-103 TaxID=2819156 RepID=UPI001BEC0168|nr:hypothetical protein [Microbacterium sp. ISL-103]MBT2473025.1 hypothetical protein [Microbacterium sp. ISL-103]
MNIPPDIATLAYEKATLIIDDSDVTEMVEQWLDDDVEGVFLTDLDARDALIGWLAIAFAGAPLDSRNVAALLNHFDTSFEIGEDDLREVTRQITSTMDDKLGADAAKLARRRREFTNAILRTQLKSTGHAGESISVALTSLMSTTDGETYEVATLVSPDLLRSDSVPNIVIGVADGTQDAAVGDLVRDLLGGENYIDHVTGDVTYFPGLPTDVALTPLRECGATVVMDYNPDDEGRVLATAEGVVLVEGRWYSDNLPEALLTAMKDFRESSRQNRTPGGQRVLSAEVQFDLEERRDALLRARRAFQVPTPPVTSTHEQIIAYGSADWSRAYRDGQYANKHFEREFLRHELALTPQLDPFPDGHSFLTTLVVAATNEQRIADWKRYHSLDEGNGILIDEWYAMYHRIVPRLQDIMSAWSRDNQPEAVQASVLKVGVGGQWVVNQDEETADWTPDGNAAVVEMTRANIETAEQIVKIVAANLRAQAHNFAREGRDLSRDARIILRLEFVDADRCGADEDDVWAAVPAEGVLIAADATLVPRDEWSRV